MTLRFFLIDAPDLQGRNEADRIFEFDAFPVSLGRGANNSISLTDPTRTVSRNHARIMGKNDQVVIVDLDSKNFTYLNDDRLNPLEVYELSEGDVLQCGDFVIRVDVLDIQRAPAPVPKQDKTLIDTEVRYNGVKNNPFDEVVVDLIDTLEQLNTIYSQIPPEHRDAMLAESISRTMDEIQESNDVVQLLADSISKTGLLNKDMFIPKNGG